MISSLETLKKLWHGLPTVPPAPTAGLQEQVELSKGSWRPAVGAGGTVGRPCHNTGPCHNLAPGITESDAHVVANADHTVKVVRITSRLNVGGIARHVTWLTEGLSATGYPTVLLSGVVPAGEEDMTAFARANGVEPIVIPQMSREISFKDIVTVWKVYRQLLALRPKLVHTHAAKAGTVGRLACWMYRWLTPGTLVGRPRCCRLVHTFHGHVFHSYYGALKTRIFITIEKLLAWLATDRIVVISRQQFQEIHHTFGVGRAQQFAIIPLGLDLDPYASWDQRRQILRDELQVGDDDLLVGIVGRLTEIKNHKLFLEAIALYKNERCVKSGRRVRFLIIGDGHLRSELETEATALGLGNDVVFLGMRDDPETFYPALDVVALTSLNEGTPLTLIEGMANARAVIATNVGGVIDLLGKEVQQEPTDGYIVCERGVLVRPRDAAAFCRGLSSLLEDTELRARLGARGLRFVHEHYAKKRLLKDVAALYQELLESPPDVKNRARSATLETPTGKNGASCES